MDFQDYYLDEVNAVRIRYYEGSSSKRVFWGEGSTQWVAERNLKRIDDTEGPVDSLAHPSRAEELRTFLASGATSPSATRTSRTRRRWPPTTSC